MSKLEKEPEAGPLTIINHIKINANSWGLYFLKGTAKYLH